MKYQVVVQPHALIEASQVALWWADNRSSDQAARWYEKFESELQELKNNPERHTFARENDSFPYILRQLLFGIGRKPTHRIIFSPEE